MNDAIAEAVRAICDALLQGFDDPKDFYAYIIERLGFILRDA